jgi:ribosomal protein L16 Arg81 hydroxylase
MSLISPQKALGRVIAPVPVEQFLVDYFEQRTLVLHRERTDYYSDLLSIETLDDFLAATRLVHPQIITVGTRREISPEEYTLSDGQIDVVRLYNLFAEGATISFRQVQDWLPALSDLCRRAEQLFNCPFHTNVYYTPANTQGFQTHHDTHDVFVLQVAGSKQWRVYEPVIRLPLPGQGFEEIKSRLGPVSEEFTLRAGDLFYCPRGFPHDARATDEASLHITLGALLRSWAEVMIEAMAGICLQDAKFRASLPLGYATGGVAPAVLEATFRELAERFSSSAQLAPAIEGIAEDFISSRRPLVPRQRHQILALDSLTLSSWVGVRPGLIYRFYELEDTIRLHCHATELTFPRRAAAALVYALGSPRFRVRDLPGDLDKAGKLLLVDRLIREGILTTLSLKDRLPAEAAE